MKKRVRSKLKMVETRKMQMTRIFTELETFHLESLKCEKDTIKA
jgi:hypothetical protein